LLSPVAAAGKRRLRKKGLFRQGLPLGTRGNPLSILRTLLFVVAIVTGCSKPEGLGPAPYVPPAAGTVYKYVGFQNTVLDSDGWRVRFADQKGRRATRVGVFITDDPDTPSKIDSAALAKLWPLANGKKASLRVTSGTYVSRWDFNVIGQAQVAVPAGTFETYIVQAMQRPDSITDPQKQTVFAYTWWYAPEVAAVVKFETTYYSGPAQGQVVRSMLEGIDSSKVGDTPKLRPLDSSDVRK
jgi:hypothetical protein